MITTDKSLLKLRLEEWNLMMCHRTGLLVLSRDFLPKLLILLQFVDALMEHDRLID